MMNRIKQHFLEDNNDVKIQEVKAAMKNNKNKRMHIRYLVIYNHLKGLQNVQIADIVGLCEHTVGTYIRKYKTKGLDGLVPVPNPGAPRLLTQEQEIMLVETISTKTPDEVGFPNRKNWNSALIREWVEITFGMKYSQSGMLYVLHIG